MRRTGEAASNKTKKTTWNIKMKEYPNISDCLSIYKEIEVGHVKMKFPQLDGK